MIQTGGGTVSLRQAVQGASLIMAGSAFQPPLDILGINSKSCLAGFDDGLIVEEVTLQTASAGI